MKLSRWKKHKLKDKRAKLTDDFGDRNLYLVVMVTKFSHFSLPLDTVRNHFSITVILLVHIVTFLFSNKLVTFTAYLAGLFQSHSLCLCLFFALSISLSLSFSLALPLLLSICLSLSFCSVFPNLICVLLSLI